ncbi:ribbon-helix-helix protein, CopG family [Mesoterricola sediminis]|nr:ribbon-helix-helix protein, CopG family [Mesoterricola sediminis]
MRVPLDLLERLEAIAAERGISRHQAIREAIAEWVEKRDAKGEEDARDQD